MDVIKVSEDCSEPFSINFDLPASSIGNDHRSRRLTLLGKRGHS